MAPAPERSMKHSLLVLTVLLVLPVAVRAQEREPEVTERRVVRLSIDDVGRLALRNEPRFQALRLDPDIARTRVLEARGEFDTFFQTGLFAGERRSEIFFNPTAFGAGGGAGSRQFQEDDFIRGHLQARRTEIWGGEWSAGYRADSTETAGSGSISSLSPRYEGAFTLGYTHPLLRGAGTDVRSLPTWRAETLTEAAAASLLRSAETTVASAELAYWDVVGARADLAVRRQSLRVARELREVARSRVESGVGIPVDVTEADAGLARREVDLISTENRLGNQADSLRASVLPFAQESALDLDLALEVVDRPTADVTNLPAMPTAADVRAVLERRGDVRAQLLRVEEAEFAVRAAEDALQYRLDAIAGGTLRGQGSGARESTSRARHRDEYDWELGLEFELPLGNDVARARLTAAERSLSKARRELTAVRNDVVRELREATRNVLSAARRIEAAERARVAASEQLDAERSRLDNGRSTPFRVLEVEEDVSVAEADLVQAKVDLAKARVQLLLARGVLLEQRNLTVDPQPAEDAESAPTPDQPE